MSKAFAIEVLGETSVMLAMAIGDPEISYDPATGKASYIWTCAASSVPIDHATTSPELAATVLRDRVIRRLEAGGFREVTPE